MEKALRPRRRWGEGGVGGEARDAGRGSDPARGRPARDPSPARAARHSKKNSGHHLRTAAQRYQRIETMKADYSILSLCEVMAVSPSGYYDWCKRRDNPGLRAVENQALAHEIKTIHANSRETYGSPRIAAQLRQDGRKHGRNRIGRLMKQEGLCGRQKRRYRVQTTQSNHNQPIAP